MSLRDGGDMRGTTEGRGEAGNNTNIVLIYGILKNLNENIQLPIAPSSAYFLLLSQCLPKYPK